jgi:CDP-diglyceride synthetase
MLMENLKTSYKQTLFKQAGENLGAERLIHAAIFMLLLAGLVALCVWAVSSYIPLEDNAILFIAILPLSWGTILLTMYLSFSKLGWKWWNNYN